MTRIIILNQSNSDVSQLQAALENKFEVTVITNFESLLDLQKNWQAHAIVYQFDTLPAHFESHFAKVSQLSAVGLVGIQTFYDFRSELTIYQNNFDHYFLIKSPLVSLELRIEKLCNKIAEYRFVTIAPTPLHLPRQTTCIELLGLKVWTERKIVMRGNDFVKVSPTQHRILLFFINNPLHTFNRDTLAKAIFLNKKISLRTIDAHIAKLKKLLPELKPWLISEYGSGYSFNFALDKKKHAA